MQVHPPNHHTRFLLWLFLIIFSFPSFANSSEPSLHFDQIVNTTIAPIAEQLSSFVFYKINLLGYPVPIIVMWLSLAAVFFTLYLSFINLRGLPTAFRLIRGDYTNPNATGEISHFQAVATAISGTVGIGNIGGVAVAISLGGPGATFWLVVAGFLSMSTKLVECTLGVKYRKVNPDGSISGGPMYYLEHYLKSRHYPKLGKCLGGFYALALVVGCLGIGNMFQSNQAYAQLLAVTGGTESFFSDKGWLFGLMMAGLVGMVILGGISAIAKVTAKLVPIMALLYVVSACVILTMSVDHLPAAFALIFSSAFSLESASGGAVGALIVGFQRAVFSNEAGIGSSSIAHSAVQTDEPASEGLVSLFEPLIDTVFICSLSALVVIATAYPTGLINGDLVGIELTSAVFAHHITWAPYPLAIAALLFAFSTTIAWSYYGLKGWTYLFGEKPSTKSLFKLMFCSFAALGSMIHLDAVLQFSDALVFLIAVPNVLGLYFYAPLVKREVTSYLRRIDNGEITNYRTQQDCQHVFPRHRKIWTRLTHCPECRAEQR
ncbi:alanine/glycine:cation symporter family protein [Vibrio ostreicida]|uniref:Alanine/glycine:cation symporter family protein n=1 Tax=Vibrio ostreicida TaxID=526588 RepID=A0ABT8BWL8_9VIBR|nr:alanine/glycine:cation symporter family protein [Vibrio ostreicida]MDN3610774.1 alanine/glycine:cation symporter family protein [Vibrio ostreicida]NPD07231.1 alanine:cation symporter family protein [Vibrio ostreicida]